MKEEEVVDLSRCPWDNKPRRPSHADKRKALQREVLHAQIEAALVGRPTKGQIRAWSTGSTCRKALCRRQMPLSRSFPPSEIPSLLIR